MNLYAFCFDHRRFVGGGMVIIAAPTGQRAQALFDQLRSQGQFAGHFLHPKLIGTALLKQEQGLVVGAIYPE